MATEIPGDQQAPVGDELELLIDALPIPVDAKAQLTQLNAGDEASLTRLRIRIRANQPISYAQVSDASAAIRRTGRRLFRVVVENLADAGLHPGDFERRASEADEIISQCVVDRWYWLFRGVKMHDRKGRLYEPDPAWSLREDFLEIFDGFCELSSARDDNESIIARMRLRAAKSYREKTGALSAMKPVKDATTLRDHRASKETVDFGDKSKSRGRRRLSGNVKCPRAARKMEDFIKTKGMTQTEFAGNANTTDRTLRSFRKTGKIRLSNLDAIAKAMGTTKEDLLKPE